MPTNSPGDAAVSDAIPGARQADLMGLHICGLNGEELMRLHLHGACTGREVRQMVAEKLPSKPGATFLLYHGVSKLKLDKTLAEQGIVDEETLTHTFCPTDLCAAWSFIQGEDRDGGEEDSFALEGVTSIKNATTRKYLYHLPSSLQSLTFGYTFNHSLEGVTFPSGLQSLMFGHDLNQNLEGVTFPSGLQSLTYVSD